jgi:hypothetical protein
MNNQKEDRREMVDLEKMREFGIRNRIDHSILSLRR